jgi:hypothetical protein
MSRRNAREFHIGGPVVFAAVLLGLTAGCSSSTDQDVRAETAAAEKTAPAAGRPVDPPGPVQQVPSAAPVVKTLTEVPGPTAKDAPAPPSGSPQPPNPSPLEPPATEPPRLLAAEPPPAAARDDTEQNPLRSHSEPEKRLVPVQPESPPQGEPAAQKPAATPPAPGAELLPKPKPPGKTEIKLATEPPAATPGASLPEGVPHTRKHSGVPFDFIKENGPIFAGWPKPRLVLVVTGRQDGYLEPCGCAGLDQMKGGMGRRYTMLQTLRNYGWPYPDKGSAAQAAAKQGGWPVVALDVGGIAKGFGPQAELKFQIAVEAMRTTRYDAIGLGTVDLELPTEFVLAKVAPAVPSQPTPFVSANVGLFAFDDATLPRTKIIVAGDRRGERKIGVTAVLGKAYQRQINNTSVKLIDPEAALAVVLPILKKKADLLVLLAYAPKDEALQLARKFPDFDLVVTAGGGSEPPAEAVEVRDANGKSSGTRLVEVGEKGEYAVVLGVFDDPQRPVRYQRVTLDSRFTASDTMIAMMSAYQDQLKGLGLAGLGIRPLEHPLAEVNGRFVGNEKCKDCHEQSDKVWRKSRHAEAFSALLGAKPPREFDPECISCHVVGWNPRMFFPYKSGYLDQKTTPKLINVGCEDCHGPGEKHVDAEAGADKALQEKLRKAVRITADEARDSASRKQNCYTCHDGDNSPEFNFDLYFPLVEHHEEK